METQSTDNIAEDPSDSQYMDYFKAPNTTEIYNPYFTEYNTVPNYIDDGWFNVNRSDNVYIKPEKPRVENKAINYLKQNDERLLAIEKNICTLTAKVNQVINMQERLLEIMLALAYDHGAEPVHKPAMPSHDAKEG